jgi:hypothetical protein
MSGDIVGATVRVTRLPNSADHRDPSLWDTLGVVERRSMSHPAGLIVRHEDGRRFFYCKEECSVVEHAKNSQCPLTEAYIDAIEAMASAAKSLTATSTPPWSSLDCIDPLADAVFSLSTEVRRLRAALVPSPAKTVRLLYPDGTHRDVDPTEPLPLQSNDGDTVSREAYRPSVWASWRQEDVGLDISADWSAPHGGECSAWVTVQVETYEQEAARERAARIEAEQQRNEALAELRRMAEEIKACAPRAPGKEP